LGVSSTNDDSFGSGPRIQQLTTVPSFYLRIGSRNRTSAYDLSIIALFCCAVVLSVTDLVTTSIALRSGLQEGNFLLLGVASLLRLNFFQTIAASKLGFISGTALLAFLGMYSDVQLTRKIVFSALAAFVILLLFVSLNNLVMINF